MMLSIVINLLMFTASTLVAQVPGPCPASLTTASGSAVQKTDRICAGELIFEDNFDKLNFKHWQHESTLAGGGNWEFQWYTNNRSNSYTEDGILHIKPTLTSEIYGEAFLSSGTLSIQGDCTNAAFWGCERTGTPTNIINPIRSARLRTLKSFSFKYGSVEVRAKLPAGDWLWPAIWMLPTDNAYGSWPSSGEIDIIESRGNRNLVENGENIGTERVASTLHFGPAPQFDSFENTSFITNTATGQGYNLDFHRYQFEWSPDRITFKIDDVETGSVDVGSGFWDRGEFDTNYPGLANPWKAGEKSAPFDQEFHLIINLAVGGVTFFPDDASNPDRKPWLNTSPKAATEFWNARDAWLKSWNYYEEGNADSHFQIDYIRVYAL
ncbi:beta-1,3-glucan-binding protein-like [Hermetia illucens]|uniref:beta-1,3-glucan-binding protein-like n=1 Tax=Hermetia illucens TaxID=343691 RepID=UPI0018CC28EA|nr:beta-1,3-glucan-binding protein-like [Hermetia illucens]